MKITGQKKHLIKEQNYRWQLFEDFQYALSAEKYAITIAGWFFDGTKRERTFTEAIGEPKQIDYTLDEFEDIIYELQGLNMIGNNIYMLPISGEYFYIVLDELKLNEEEMWKLNTEYLPCLILGTPTKNYQYILKVRKSEVGEDIELLNQFVKNINEKYGENSSIDSINHSFRVPGYAVRGQNNEAICDIIPLLLSDAYYSEKAEKEICKLKRIRAKNK